MCTKMLKQELAHHCGGTLGVLCRRRGGSLCEAEVCLDFCIAFAPLCFCVLFILINFVIITCTFKSIFILPAKVRQALFHGLLADSDPQCSTDEYY